MATFRGLAVSISILAATLLVGVGRPTAQTANPVPLQLEAKIPLGEVRGRIDHMAIDLARQRLFVAELGNDTVGIVDLKKREVIQTISGLREPQGLGYVPAMDALYIANAGDGSVRIFAGADYAAAGRIDLGEDADNIRVDGAANQIVVGYGSGGLAVIDATTLQRIADIPLPVHPEGFQLDSASSQVFVNLPKAHAIASVDRHSGKLTTSWPIAIAGDNFPMALRRDAGEILTVFRNPSKLAAFSIKDGALLASADVCGDADDLFVDPKRQRVYVSCGEGFIDVLDAKDSAYRPAARIATVPGARTSLFVPELDRLLLAVRAEAGQPAAIWVFRPTP
jgi:DNA-binding beta-propeller fold protein YncE